MPRTLDIRQEAKKLIAVYPISLKEQLPDDIAPPMGLSDPYTLLDAD